MADPFKSCAIEGCNRNAHRSAGGRKDMCGLHYQRAARYGDPYREPWKNEPIDWLRSHAGTQSRECLIWPFSLDDTGYGLISIRSPQGGRRKGHAHRYMCELAKGPAPTRSHQAAHACGNRACVNPRHLSWKTQRENEADKLIHGTSNRGERCGSSKLTADDVIAIRAAKGITQQALADRFGVSRGHIAGLRRGRFWPDLQSQQS
jgi:hypothetical protein